jgi:hypothetical protein
MTVAQIEDMALNQVLALQPVVNAAGIAVQPNLTNAATNIVKSETDIADAETKRFDVITKRNEKVASEINNSIMFGKGYDEIRTAEAAARKAGKDPVAARKAVVDRITRETEAKNPIPSPVRAAPPPAAPAAPAPDKTKKKEAVPPLPPGFKPDNKS